MYDFETAFTLNGERWDFTGSLRLRNTVPIKVFKNEYRTFFIKSFISCKFHEPNQCQ